MIYCDSQFMYAESGIFHSNRDEEHLSRLPYSNDGEMMAQQPVLCTVLHTYNQHCCCEPQRRKSTGSKELKLNVSTAEGVYVTNSTRMRSQIIDMLVNNGRSPGL